MSSFANADLGSSSDEDDQDFIPSSPKPKGANGKRAADERDDPAVKAAKLEKEAQETLERKRKAAEAFAAMRDGPGDEKDKELGLAAVEMVEIKRLRRFAGETLEETVSLPPDHPEVVAYLRKQPTAPAAGDDNKQQETPTVSADNSAAGPPVPTSVTPTAPLKRAPPRKKPRQSLEQMSAALDKGKKMTTLEKSQLDWKSHTSSDARMQAELESHRRTGGYIEKQEFLDRVGDRKEAKSAELGKRR